MEKYIEWFKELDTLEKLNQLNKLTKEMVTQRKRIEKDLNTTNVTFASKSFSNGRRNASANSKRANMNTIYRLYDENKELLKIYSKML